MYVIFQIPDVPFLKAQDAGRLGELNHLLRHAELVEVTDEADRRAMIGSEVVYIDWRGQEKTIRIGSYRTKPESDTVPYSGPVPKALVAAQAKAGDIVEVKLGKQELECEVIAVKRWM